MTKALWTAFVFTWVLRLWVLENPLSDMQCCLRAPLPKECCLCNRALCFPPLGLLLTALMHLSDRKQQHSPKLELFSDRHSHVPVVLQLVSTAGTGAGLFCSGQCFEIPELSSKENFTQFMWSKLSNSQAFSFQGLVQLYKCFDIGAPPRQQVLDRNSYGCSGTHWTPTLPLGLVGHHPALAIWLKSVLACISLVLAPALPCCCTQHHEQVLDLVSSL